MMQTLHDTVHDSAITINDEYLPPFVIARFVTRLKRRMIYHLSLLYLVGTDLVKPWQKRGQIAVVPSLTLETVRQQWKQQMTHRSMVWMSETIRTIYVPALSLP